MTEIGLSIAYFILFCLVISKLSFFADNIISKKWFIALFSIKVVASIILTAIYTRYYTNRETADIFKYFDDSQHMFKAFQSNPIDFFKMIFAIDNDNAYFTSTYYQHMLHWVRPYSVDFFSDSHIIIRFNAFVRIFSFGQFQVHNIFINFISLLGLTALYKTFKPYLIGKEKALFYIIALIPSALFWGSGLLKESLIFFGLGFLLLHFFKLLKKPTLTSTVVCLLSILLIMFTKFYLLAAFAIPITGYLINSIVKKRIYFGYLIASITLIIVALLLPLVNPDLDIIFQIANKQKAFSTFISKVENGSGFILPELSNAWSIIKYTPNAILNTLIRPFPWECHTPFLWMNLLENIAFILIIVITIVFRTKQLPHKNILFLLILFSLGLLTLIGLTTPVFGAIIRYKIPALLFLMVALLIIIDLEKLKQKHKYLRKLL